MAEYITKKKDIYEEGTDGKKHKTGTKEITYRVDAAFVPTKIDEICDVFIENYCKANKETNWLVTTLKTKIKTKSVEAKNGKAAKASKEIDIPFIALRRKFAEKFFPNLVSAKSGEMSWRDRILATYDK